MTCRHICLFCVSALLVLALGAGASTLSDLSRDVAAIAKQTSPAAVQIDAERSLASDGYVEFGSFRVPALPEAFRKSVGSGFVVDPDGYILTSNDVVVGAKAITVRFNDGSRVPGTLIGSDALLNCALIRVEKQGLKALGLGDSDAIQPGMLVLTVNSQAGMSHSVSLGVVAAIDREVGTVPGLVMQISGTVGPGSSGGPVLDTEGRVVGMTFAMFSPTESAMPFNLPKIFVQPKPGSKGESTTDEIHPGLNVSPEDAARWLDLFMGARGRTDGVGAVSGMRDALVNLSGISGSSGFAIPINRIKAVIDQLKSGKPIERGMLGIELRPKDGDIVLEPAPGSPAEKAGVKTGDVLLSIDGHRFARHSEVVSYVMGLKPGGKVDLVVRRDGKELSIAVTTVPRIEKPAKTGVPPAYFGGLKSGGKISLSLDDAGIAEVAKALSEASGKNVVVLNPETIKGKVTVHMKSATLESALSFICEALKCKYAKSAQGYVIQAAK